MFAIFDTIEEYVAKNNAINIALGYPDGMGTDRYADETPAETTTGKYAMQILPCASHLFAGCVIVESVEYPKIEVENENQ